MPAQRDCCIAGGSSLQPKTGSSRQTQDVTLQRPYCAWRPQASASLQLLLRCHWLQTPIMNMAASICVYCRSHTMWHAFYCITRSAMHAWVALAGMSHQPGILHSMVVSFVEAGCTLLGKSTEQPGMGRGQGQVHGSLHRHICLIASANEAGVLLWHLCFLLLRMTAWPKPTGVACTMMNCCQDRGQMR